MRASGRAPKGLPVVYRDVQIGCGDRIDLLVERRIIVAFKAVAQLAPIHEAQSLSYLKLSGCHVGLLIDFNVKLLRNGVRRLVNELKE
jgi:GxxExxY protein